MQTVVTTASVSPSKRFDHWAEEMSKRLVSLDSRPTSPRPFHGNAACSAIGQLQLTAINAGPIDVRRTSALAARDSEDCYKVALQIAGTALIEQDDNRDLLGPGDIAICDASRPYTFTYENDFHTVLMMLPRTMLPVRPDALRPLYARRLAGDEGIAPVVGPYLRSLVDQSAVCTGAVAGRLMDGTVSLVTALVAERLDRAAPIAPHQAMLLRIRDYIERNLSDPDLTPDAIAVAHSISRRYLFKLFAADGCTVSGWIRERRLERCARELAGVQGKDQTISLIAARWGLLDSRHFSRAFKAAYGVTPREFRDRSLTGSVPTYDRSLLLDER
ncbi:helix-turn-helix domain-containing protein [Streptomyces europaeiscabiei]|uniref:AraC-like ligand-binding domain-containing protein n=1 Tax=Streptomyces europaeiscabiei TaxID=146819 RepID=UPI002E118F5A|nr:helix-turn-helix domain-containing protein [Streptomyces europaeiscabiei]